MLSRLFELADAKGNGGKRHVYRVGSLLAKSVRYARPSLPAASPPANRRAAGLAGAVHLEGVQLGTGSANNACRRTPPPWGRVPPTPAPPSQVTRGGEEEQDLSSFGVTCSNRWMTCWHETLHLTDHRRPAGAPHRPRSGAGSQCWRPRRADHRGQRQQGRPLPWTPATAAICAAGFGYVYDVQPAANGASKLLCRELAGALGTRRRSANNTQPCAVCWHG